MKKQTIYYLTEPTEDGESEVVMTEYGFFWDRQSAQNKLNELKNEDLIDYEYCKVHGAFIN